MARNSLFAIQNVRHLIRIALIAAFLLVAAGDAPTTEAGRISIGEEIPTLTRG